MKNERGSAVIVCIILLFIISIIGMGMLTSVRMDKSSQSSYNRTRTAKQAAFTSFKACEGLFHDKPLQAISILNDYINDNSKKWLLSALSDIHEEHTISMDGNSSSPKFSANIVGFGVGYFEGVDMNTPFIKIEGIGYGKYGGETKGIALYKLNGLMYVSPPSPQYAIYIATDGYDFNQPVILNGDIYFGSGFRFNSNANGSIINGNIKTADKNIVSEFNGGVTINGKAFFQTPIKIQNYNINISGSGGFKRDIELSKNLILGDNSYFNSLNITGSSTIDLNNHVANYYNCNTDHFNNYIPSNNGSEIDIADQLGMPDGNDDPPIFNISILSSYIQDINFTEFTGTNVQTAYNNTPSNKKWNGYMVMRIKNSSNVNFNNTQGSFNDKVIWIIEKSLGINGKWYASGTNASTILYVKDGGNLSQIGWPGCMKGYIYVTGTGSITYAFLNGSSFEGAINHVNGSGFQVNTSNTVTITYDGDLINDLSTFGLITETIYTPDPVLTLVDAKIRPVLMSLQL